MLPCFIAEELDVRVAEREVVGAGAPGLVNFSRQFAGEQANPTGRASHWPGRCRGLL